MDFKNQLGQPFFSHHMAYRYLNHCPSAPMYITNVFLKLLTSGKKFGIYEPKFHYPIAWEGTFGRSRDASGQDKIYIEQTKEEQVENLAKNSLAPSHPIVVTHSPDLTATAHPAQLLEIYEGSSIVKMSKRMSEKPTSTLYTDVQMHSFHPSPLL
ncbi:hypothetical protein SELMODRAFT_431734 [Selaginella moellendorffii]|uniref:Uncharacterized protein n=1 Tax=Selaginella moellendorffii TaxID=88036 RepID=D8TDL8_SELML|nr:hypothetical protein SELMODRAFT_431734 [Selaginella moellendorffii]